MGCGASKNDVLNSGKGNEPTNKSNPAMNGNADHATDDDNVNKDSMNSSVVSEGSTIPASEMYQNGNGKSNNGSGPLRGAPHLKTLPPLKPPRSSKVGFLDQNTNESGEMNLNRPTEMPVAFEVPADDAADGSLIKRHPPRRLRQLEERPPEAISNLTQESLEEKVQLANQRRSQVLSQRVASARQKSARTTRMKKPLFDSGQFPTEYGGEIETAEKDEQGANEFM